MMHAPGLFDLSDHLARLSAKKDSYAPSSFFEGKYNRSGLLRSRTH